MSGANVRRTYDLAGVIQGVGFRPTVFRLAAERGLGGSVQNRSGAVRLVLEGLAASVDEFMAALPGAMPGAARLDSVTLLKSEEASPDAKPPGFRMLPSDEDPDQEVQIPADLSVCPACAAEIRDPKDRRYGYVFTTCTDCGPRYTVVNAMPYDRERTTLSCFPLCEDCRREYDDPASRRFHAESTACPACGPTLWVEDGSGRRPTGAPLAVARHALAGGHIVAVRGIGGFLLAADAFNRGALKEIRRRKRRPHKPFAVMASNLETLRRYCDVPPVAEQLLGSREAPIVILDVKPQAVAAGRLPVDLITPDAMTLGCMLPTSPLHMLLLEPSAGDPVPPFELLIMTSGNRRGEPICITNAEARERLGDVADLLLLHDREINLRNDDSLCIVQHGAPQVWRRGRGFAPNPVRLARPLVRCVLAMGAEIKNTVAIGYGRRVVLSPHVGDLETPEALEGLAQVTECLPAFLRRTPQCVAVDLHPDMHATAHGVAIAERLNVPLVRVQHHHAHAVACLAEHGHEEGLALVFDGTGLGPDGAIWGAELLAVSPGGYERLATFAPVPLPGGDRAVLQPARQVVGRWVEAGRPVTDAWRVRLGITAEEVSVWAEQCRRGLNAPLTHAAGRLFDSVAVLLGLAPAAITYEGQPAIRLEAAARRCVGRPLSDLPFSTLERDGMLLVGWRDAVGTLSERRHTEGREDGWAMAAHIAIASAGVRMVKYGIDRRRMRTVVLSGGVFMNRILNDLLIPELEASGLTALIHRQTPPNDGCISLGQAVVAGSAEGEE